MTSASDCSQCRKDPLSETPISETVVSARHRGRLSRYLSNLKRGRAAVCDTTISDWHRRNETGTLIGAADVLLALRLLLSGNADDEHRHRG